MSDYTGKLRGAAAEGAWQLLQHFVCRDYKTSQRGNGAGGVHTRHNAHRLYPMPSPTEVEKKPEDKKCEKVTIKMVSPAQATVERAKSEAKQLKGSTQGKCCQSVKKRPRDKTPTRPKKKRIYSDTVFQDGSRLD